MTNRDKLLESFPYLESIGTVLIDKRTEQVIAAHVNFNWLNTEYEDKHIIGEGDKDESCD